MRWTCHVALSIALTGCASLAEPTSAPARSGTLSGIVVDAEGHPTRAKVAVVSGSGSQSATTSDTGSFFFGGLDQRAYVVTATTRDGRIAVLGDVHAGAELRLPALSGGATLVVEMTGHRAARLAVLHAGLRVHDLTLRESEAAELVVPPGEVTLELYDGAVMAKRRLTLSGGDSATVAFDVKS